MRVFLPILILALAIVGFVVLKDSKPQSTPREQVKKVWHVDTVTVVKSSYSPELVVYGRVETPRQTAITAALSADVNAVYKRDGQQVEANDILIELDAVDAELVVQQRKADLVEINASIDVEMDSYRRDKSVIDNEKALLKLADKAVERNRKMEQTRLTSAATLDDSLAAMQRQLVTIENLEASIKQHPARLKQLQARKISAESLLEQAERDLARTIIKSPFSGRIAKLNVSEGSRVRAGDPLITVYDLSDLEVRAQIPSRYIPAIRKMIVSGQTVQAEATIDGEQVPLTLSRLSGEVRVDSGGTDAYFALSNNTLPFALGAFVNLTVNMPLEEEIIALPQNALYGLNYVYKIEQGKLKSTKVEQVGEVTLDSGDKRILLRSDGLTEGDKVIITQLPNAITGLNVEAVND